MPPNPRTRLIYETPDLTGYEVVADVWPDVIAYGILVLPKNLKPGEQRPVVVCQHGLEGRPSGAADPRTSDGYMHHFAVKLAQEGFITFAPQNPTSVETVFGSSSDSLIRSNCRCSLLSSGSTKECWNGYRGSPMLTPSESASTVSLTAGRRRTRAALCGPLCCLDLYG